MNRWLWDAVQNDLISLQNAYKDLGYSLTLEQCYDAWYMYSEYCMANWLRIDNVEKSIWCVKK